MSVVFSNHLLYVRHMWNLSVYIPMQWNVLRTAALIPRPMVPIMQITVKVLQICMLQSPNPVYGETFPNTVIPYSANQPNHKHYVILDVSAGAQCQLNTTIAITSFSFNIFCFNISEVEM